MSNGYARFDAQDVSGTALHSYLGAEGAMSHLKALSGERTGREGAPMKAGDRVDEGDTSVRPFDSVKGNDTK